MPFPTDRGYAVITEHEDGTSTVEIATGFDRGSPTGVYARHVGVSAIRVDPGVHLSGSAGRRVSRQVVEVLPAGGAILIRPVTPLVSPTR